MKLVMALLTNWQLTGPVQVNQKMTIFGVCSVAVWVRTWELKKLGLKALFCFWASKCNYWEISPTSKFHFWAAKQQISWVIAPWWIFIPFLWPSGSLLLPAAAKGSECHLHFASIKLCQASLMCYRFCREMSLSLLFYSSIASCTNL